MILLTTFVLSKFRDKKFMHPSMHQMVGNHRLMALLL